MKRFLILLVVVSFGIALLGSCKSQNCPAYSQVETGQVVIPG